MTGANGTGDKTGPELPKTQDESSASANPDVEVTQDSSTVTGISATERTSTQSKSIGPYRLLRKIGEGGMGQVWLVEQTAPVRRQVALKLIKVGMYDDAVLRRFESERQSLAIMDHPSIAKVFDAGSTPDGQPYFVMEYVPGVPITEYCDEKRLSIRERLELFIKVCEGVQHAHLKAIIHRDLKPANILVTEVDGKPLPRIRRRSLGPEHPQTLISMGNLGFALLCEGRYAEAEKLHREALDLMRRVLGPGHPETIVTMGGLALVLSREGHYAEAEKLARDSIDISRRVLGPENSNTAVRVYYLACIEARKGNRSEALSLLRQALDHGLPISWGLGMDSFPDLTSLHGDPRFIALVANVKQRAAAAQNRN